MDRSLTEINILKSRYGRYKDNAENRRKHRVGQTYGEQALEKGIEALLKKGYKNLAAFQKGIDSVCKETGCISTPINIKTLSSIRRKTGVFGGPENVPLKAMKDVVRNTFITDRGNIDNVIKEIKKTFKVVRHKVQKAEDNSGYTGNILNVEFPNGFIGEIQVNTPEMIYAKESPVNAKQLLGDDLYNDVHTRAAKAGIEGGKGHELYEKIRVLDFGAPERATLERESKEYYDKIKEI